VILHTVVHEPPTRVTLATVHDKLTRDPADLAALLADMQASTGVSGLIARAANRQVDKSNGRPRACSPRRSATPTSWTAPAWWTAPRRLTSGSQT
jgi:hypothetical protein